jgi:acetate kinase
MAVILCLNSGSNSLKFDVVEIDSRAKRASEGIRFLTGSIDDIGKKATLEVLREGKKLLSKKLKNSDISAATESVFDALEQLKENSLPALGRIELVAVRVVHGGDAFSSAVFLDDHVLREIEARSELAPLHNPNALKVIESVRRKKPSLSIAVAFDTAFHHSLPERAWRYPLDVELADRYKIRKYGFHGISHRYLLEHFAYLSGRPKSKSSIVTMHLEGGSSVAAIQSGRSIETSMGFTPLEGLMMGTRSGSIDPAILPFLMQKENLSADEVLNVFEKKSGLLGVSGVSQDTRILRQRTDPSSMLALEMFGYRVRQMVGAYLAVLGDAQAIVFGGGIGENTPEVRSFVCGGLKQWGIELDGGLNDSTLSGDECISTAKSSREVWVIHSDEGMQLAYECVSVTSS